MFEEMILSRDSPSVDRESLISLEITSDHVQASRKIQPFDPRISFDDN